ncbi:peptide ABC transporter ATP-binding protein [Compostibacillus humi]|uniref:Nickel import system ATP-binding protein NikD n=1 Tax=Compostibacillus humi TaxID=1245525 RepID=A0A8J2TS85_9BACI|nr:ABC transporter ATP-binding protein [Compostibacillus humi]GFZ76845.1 peptide ABC transporter ATP-binding protein [Compostibacillus humi]
MMTRTKTVLLEVKDFSMTLKQSGRTLNIIRSLDLTVHKQEMVAIIGASGAGKSILADAIIGLLPRNAVIEGKMEFLGQPLTDKLQANLRGREIILIPQMTNALNPLITVGKQVGWTVGRVNKKKRLKEIFQQVGLAETVMAQYPHELSGGMMQKVFLAIALASQAQLIIADEPTKGLDKEAVNAALGHLRQLADAGRGIVLITHDIQAAVKFADTIVVYYGGKTIEVTEAANFSGNGDKLKHPYTRALWNALPENGFIPDNPMV